MTMVIFFHTSVERCGRDHGISREEGVWPSSSKRERSMTMAIFLSRTVEVVMAYLLKKRRSALPISRKKRMMTMAT